MKLVSQKRDANTALSVIREAGNIPAVCYGPDVESVAIVISRKDLAALITVAGSSTIVDLDIDGEEHEVLLKDIDRDPVSEEIQHVDFYAIKRGAEIEVDVPVVFVGTSKAAERGAVLTEIYHELPVRSRPRSLPEQIEVDLSALEEIGDSITVDDLKIDEGVTILVDSESAIAVVSEAKEEVVEEEDTSAEDMAEVLADKAEDGDESEASETKED